MQLYGDRGGVFFSKMLLVGLPLFKVLHNIWVGWNRKLRCSGSPGKDSRKWWTVIDNGPLLQKGRTYLAVLRFLLNCESILYLSGDIILQWFVLSALSGLEKKVGHLSEKYLFEKVEPQMLKLRLLALSRIFFFQWNCLERGRHTLQIRYQSHCHSVAGICYLSDFKQDLHWVICLEMRMGFFQGIEEKNQQR